MSDSASIGFPEAARRLGVSLRTLHQAIRDGRIPAPPQRSATAALPFHWVESAAVALAETSRAQRSTQRQKVLPFARYEGTSAWHEYHTRVREYARYRATAQAGAGRSDRVSEMSEPVSAPV